jgi:hypothetical protein
MSMSTWTIRIETEDESVKELFRRGLYLNNDEAFNEAMRLVYSGDRSIVRVTIVDYDDEREEQE